MSQSWNMPEEEEKKAVAGEEGAESAEVPFSESRASHPLNAGTVLLLGVFVAGLAMIYFLGMQNKPRAASAEQVNIDARVDSAIADLMGKNKSEIQSIFTDTDQIVQMFYNYRGVGSTPVEKLAANPFVHNMPAAQPVGADDVSANVSTENPEQERTKKIADAFAGLKLQTVLYSRRNSAAIINGEMVTSGSSIAGFVVMDIQPQMVILRNGTQRFALHLNTDLP